jgi:Tfp pilus assembly protein PilV
LRKPASHSRSIAGFTLVEVMMAAIILTVGFMGLIQAVTICSGMMDQARRETLAAQILNNEIEQLRLTNWSTISSLPTIQTTICTAWNSGKNYFPGDSVTYLGDWYRCVISNAGNTPTNASFWKRDAPPYANVITTEGVAFGASYTVSRSVTDLAIGNLREAIFTVTWVVKTSRHDDDGNPVTFTYSRVNSSYFSKYGLNLTYQRS